MVKRTKRNLKSGRDHTGATSVKRWITWPHEVIYGADREPAAYKDLSVSAFIREYLIVLTREQVKEHMVLHLEDMDVHGWEKIRAFHATWMNQLEQGRCEWSEADHKLKMRRALV